MTNKAKELVKKYEEILNTPFHQFKDKDWKIYDNFSKELKEISGEKEE